MLSPNWMKLLILFSSHFQFFSKWIKCFLPPDPMCLMGVTFIESCPRVCCIDNKIGEMSKNCNQKKPARLDSFSVGDSATLRVCRKGAWKKGFGRAHGQLWRFPHLDLQQPTLLLLLLLSEGKMASHGRGRRHEMMKREIAIESSPLFLWWRNNGCHLIGPGED